ncbi:unnamed protein product, partial [Didymodactylos carnosus]
MCEMNKIELVDVDLVRCLSCDLIPKLLIEKYLIEITRSNNVAFEPDPAVMAQDEFWAIGQRYVQHPPPPPEERKQPPPSSGGSSNSGGSGGGNGITGGLAFPDIPQSTPSAPQAHTTTALNNNLNEDKPNYFLEKNNPNSKYTNDESLVEDNLTIYLEDKRVHH